MQKLAAIRYDRGYPIDRLIGTVCEALRDRQLRLGGLSQVSSSDSATNCMVDVQLVDLMTHTAYDIWQENGGDPEVCQLCEDGLAHADNALRSAIDANVDLMVVNRFGRAESEGRGLRDSIAAAAVTGIPVLTAVREPYVAAWDAFHDGLGVELPCDPGTVIDWALRAYAGARATETVEPA